MATTRRLLRRRRRREGVSIVEKHSRTRERSIVALCSWLVFKHHYFATPGIALSMALVSYMYA